MTEPARHLADEAVSRPAGFCLGRGHVLVFGNADLLAEFGPTCVGMPAREALVGLPASAFALMDTVLESGRPLARWIRRGGSQWRLTVAPRMELGTGEVYGVALYLRRRDDQAGRHERDAT